MTAIYHGADAVMLSAERASGKFPLEAVPMMERILGKVKSDPCHRQLLQSLETHAQPTSSDTIFGAMDVTSGSTSIRAARERPAAPILGMTPSLASARRLAFVWRVHSVRTEEVSDVAAIVEHACRCAREEGFAKPVDAILISARILFEPPDATNLLRSETVQ